MMQGFPPSPEAQVTLANWRTPPFNKWGFQHVQEIVPSANIKAAEDGVMPLPTTAVDLGDLRISGVAGGSLDFDAFLEHTHTDTIVILRDGAIVFEQFADYANEEQTGEGLARAMSEGLVGREDLWVTSKLWNTFHAPEHVEEACRKSLSDLRLDYLDLYLVHFPIALRHVPIEKRYPPEWVYDPAAQNPRMERAAVPLHETWAAMEALVDSGLVKNIGVCNYNTALIHDLMSYARIKPAMLQIESHPYLTQERLIRLAGDYGIDVTAFSPLGAQSYFELGMANEGESLMKAAPVMVAAEAHEKTPAQVLLRWGIQRGTAIIPKTSKPERMRENLAIDDFELSQVEMAAISALNQNRRFNDPGTFTEAAFNTFHPIYD